MINLFAAARKIPWGPILKNAPLIADAVRKFYDTIKKHGKSTKPPPKQIENIVSSLNKRVESLENNEVEQAELTSKIADQMEIYSNNLRVISLRVNIVFLISIVAIILSLFVLVRYLL